MQVGNWTDYPLAVSCERGSVFATCGPTLARRWRFSQQAVGCGAQRFTTRTAQLQLRGGWVVFAGDSITRMLYLALLGAAGAPVPSIVERHADLETELEGGTRVSFLWQSYPSNLTEMFEEWRTQATPPDLVVCSASLWHMLWVTDAQDFDRQLRALAHAAQAYLDQTAPPPPCSWRQPPTPSPTGNPLA